MNIDQLTELFKWMSLIGIGLIILSSALVITLKDSFSKAHSSLFGVKPQHVLIVAYAYLGALKVLVIVTALIPYAALLLTNQ